MSEEFQSEHKLPFEVAPWNQNLNPNYIWTQFRIGTCEGLFCATPISFDILAVINSMPGNGHFNDVLQWFEYSCRRDNKLLRILETWNQEFKIHLIEKRGFINVFNDNLVKHFE